MAFSWTGKRVRWSEAEQPALQEPDGYRQTESECARVTARSRLGARNLRPEAPSYRSAGEAVPQASLAGQVRPCAFSLPTHPTKEKPQGRNRSAPARAAGPDAASCCWRCVGKMADSVEERRPTLHSPISDSICQRGRVTMGVAHALPFVAPIQPSHAFAPSRNVTRELTRVRLAARQCRTLAGVSYPNAPAKSRSQKCTFSGALRGSAGEPSDDQIAASETKAGSAHTAHDPALVSPGPTGLTSHPNTGMHLLVTGRIARPRMHRNHEIVCDDCHSLPLKN